MPDRGSRDRENKHKFMGCRTYVHRPLNICSLTISVVFVFGETIIQNEIVSQQHLRYYIVYLLDRLALFEAPSILHDSDEYSGPILLVTMNGVVFVAIDETFYAKNLFYPNDANRMMETCSLRNNLASNALEMGGQGLLRLPC